MDKQKISRERLSEMPLHEITLQGGTEGLINRFSYEVAKFPEEDQYEINRAFLTAAEWHKDQTRTNGPYIDHILRVALRVMVHFKISDPDIIIASIFHDSVEDQRDKIVGKDDATVDEALANLQELYNPRVARIVGTVTNPRDGMDDEEYDAHIREALIEDPEAIPVKLSDVIDNAAGILWTSGKTEDEKNKKQAKLSRKYIPVIPFYEQIVTDDLYLFEPDVKRLLLSQLNNAKVRMTDILKHQAANNAGAISIKQL